MNSVSDSLTRRRLLTSTCHAFTAAAATGGLFSGLAAHANPAADPAANDSDAVNADATATEFQLACMTLPYSRFPLDRALEGIRAAGYRFVAWGTSHRETSDGPPVPVISADAPPTAARELAKRCRGVGLEPLMMFSTVYPEADDGLEVLARRIRQAAAGELRQVLTFGHTSGGNRKIWVERFKRLGPIARDHGVVLVVKQHGGSTGTGQACAEIIREVDDPGSGLTTMPGT